MCDTQQGLDVQNKKKNLNQLGFRLYSFQKYDSLIQCPSELHTIFIFKH